MKESFQIGEIAVVVIDGEGPAGTEVRIDSPVHYRRGYWLWKSDPYYVISSIYGRHWCSEKYLRKRRPPQDWVKLCNLHDIPRDAPHANVTGNTHE